jgi:hypothetical protein
LAGQGAANPSCGRLSGGPIFIVVHRFDNSVYYRRIGPEEFRILTAIRRGDRIANAIEAGYEGTQLSSDEYQANIAKWFAVWSELGWLCQPTHTTEGL